MSEMRSGEDCKMSDEVYLVESKSGIEFVR